MLAAGLHDASNHAAIEWRPYVDYVAIFLPFTIDEKSVSGDWD